MRTFKFKKLKRIHGLHFAPDGGRVLGVGGQEVGMIDSAVWLDLASGESGARVDQFAESYAVDPALTRYLICGANTWKRGMAAVQWTPLSGPPKWHPIPSPRGVMLGGAAFDPAGTRVVFSTQRDLRPRAGDAEERLAFGLHLAPLDTGEPVNFAAEDAGRVLAFNADGTRLAFTGGAEWKPTAEVYDLTARERLFRFEPPATRSRAVLFLPDNRLVLANGRDVYVLPATGGEPLVTFSEHPKQVNAVALTPDGRRVLSASHDGTIRAWDPDTGEVARVFDWHIGPVTAVAFAPDGLTCAAAGTNGRVVVWDVDG